MQFCAVGVSSAIQPGLVVETDRIYNQRVALPMTDRVPQPRGSESCIVLSPVGENLADEVVELEQHDHPAWHLHDLHRKWLQIQTGHSGRKAAHGAERSGIDGVVRIFYRAGSEGRLGGFESLFGPGSHGWLVLAEAPGQISSGRRAPDVPDSREIRRIGRPPRTGPPPESERRK